MYRESGRPSASVDRFHSGKKIPVLPCVQASILQLHLSGEGNLEHDEPRFTCSVSLSGIHDPEAATKLGDGVILLVFCR